MLRFPLLHPEILQALGRAGHGSKVLIADGNYPFTTGSHPAATRVFLNLRPGLVNATDALAAIAGA
ncbi:MAG TPA: RbsD/FucU domain-containing protein, partial [Limnochordia bacterium]|nr:RbsD/FucU domain-containing protein [Limnochordia bacterium]